MGGALRLLERWLPDVVFAGPAAGRVALTFDDGPEPSTTGAVLDRLDAHEAKATFFLIGERVKRHPDLARAIRDRGHELGNHGWREERALTMPRDELERSLAQTHDAIVAATGIHPTLYRPGGGLFDGDVRRVVRDRAGYTLVAASVYVFDIDLRRPRVVAQAVRALVHDGAVVALHEGPGRHDLVTGVLDRLLPHLARRYGITTVTALRRR